MKLKKHNFVEKIIFSFCIFFLSMPVIYGQSVPLGMKYQAVARDLSGEFLPLQNIWLKVKLQSGLDVPVVHYTEIHSVQTNELGLFSLEIGNGEIEDGIFNKVPWSTEDIWMEIAIKNKDESNFSLISNSRLLAVPYAFHAATANELVNQKGTAEGGGPGPGVPSNVWSLFGNSHTDPTKDKLGTTDVADLVMITNNIERLRITSAGDVNIVNNLSVGNDLDVGNDLHVGHDAAIDNDVELNVTGGATVNHGNLTVDDMSATYLTGTLVVDEETDLNSSFDVNNASPSNLSGTLTVDSATVLNHTLNVNGLAQFDSNVNVDASTVSDFLVVTDEVSPNPVPRFGSIADVRGYLVGDSISIVGGLDIGGNLKVHGDSVIIDHHLRVGGITALNNTLNVTAGTNYIANFVNTSNANGISIQVASATPANANNFVTFKNNSGGVVGRIEGETLGELITNDEYIKEKGALDLAVSLATIDVVTGGVAVVLAAADLIAASTSSTGCAGLGACVTAPVPSLIVAATANQIAVIADEIAIAIGLADANSQLNFFVTNMAANIGVTYQSGSGDYAEWLPKANPEETFSPGQVVGIKNGQISLNTKGADKLFVISTKPIVLGNMPENGKQGDYAMAAFMGQVPVHVIGKVNSGDYILPSGYNNGFAKAISPLNMKAEDYANIVGMAWSSSNSDSYSQINVAIGLNAGDISNLVREQSKEIEALKRQNQETNTILAKLVPGFKEAAGIQMESPIKKEIDHSLSSHVNPIGGNDNLDILTPDGTNILYFEITENMILEGIDMAEAIFIENGGDINTHPFWKRMKTDPSYNTEIVSELSSKMEKAVHMHQEVNK
jgi:hypothetical protein